MIKGMNQAGYHGRLKQPEQIIRLTLPPCPQSVDWSVLDNLLHKKLGLEVISNSPQSIPSGTSQKDYLIVFQLLWRVLQVAALLQRAARLPIFDPGKILGIKPDGHQSKHWLCRVSVPQLDYIPLKSIQLACNGAALVVFGMAADPDSFTDAESLYDQLESMVLKPLSKMMPAGKSVLPLLSCACEQNIPWRHIGGGLFRLGWGKHSLYTHNSKVESDSVIGVAAVQDKWLAGEWMRRAGLPAPQHRLVNNAEEAKFARQALGWPLVVKPADRDRGEGVTVGIESDSAMLIALQKADKLSKRLLVERQVTGVCHRLLVVHGQVLYTVKRSPVSVEGNGVSTIKMLIDTANQRQAGLPKWHREPLFPCDDLAVQCLQQAGWRLDSVLPAGVLASLRQIETTEWGGLDEDFSATLHPDNAAIACRAAALFSLDVAGIDIISPDITQPWYQNGAIINEVNASPVLGQSQSSLRVMPQLLESLLPHQGRIAIEACVGSNQALRRARDLQKVKLESGVNCYVTSHDMTLDPAGHLIPMPMKGIFLRCMALLANKSVAAIILLVQTDELLYTGLPVDQLGRLEISTEPLSAWSQETDSQSSTGRTEELLNLLRSLSVCCQQMEKGVKHSLSPVIEAATP